MTLATSSAASPTAAPAPSDAAPASVAAPPFGRLLPQDEFEERIRQIGAERYHSLHPFHKLLHGGKCNHGQVQAWVLNRYCYQSHIPLKDAALLSRMEDLELRREWRKRIEDHDGREGNEGGIERWLVLAEGVGLDRAYVAPGHIPPGAFVPEGMVPVTELDL